MIPVGGPDHIAEVALIIISQMQRKALELKREQKAP